MVLIRIGMCSCAILLRRWFGFRYCAGYIGCRAAHFRHSDADDSDDNNAEEHRQFAATPIAAVTSDDHFRPPQQVRKEDSNGFLKRKRGGYLQVPENHRQEVWSLKLLFAPCGAVRYFLFLGHAENWNGHSRLAFAQAAVAIGERNGVTAWLRVGVGL